MKEIRLKKNKDRIADLRHPWIFSGALDTRQKFPGDGDLVRVLKSDGDFVGIGHYYTGSIAVRILSNEDRPTDQAFWNEKISNAINYRVQLGLYDLETNNALRLVHGEGDGLSGLIIDYYKGLTVIQCHGYGMHKSIDSLKNALLQQALLPVEAILVQKKYESDKNADHELIHGDITTTQIIENGIQLVVDAEKGQKTGFFLDQKDNRKLIEGLSKDKKVLNTFCYNGGFSLFALRGGASKVVSIDASALAIQQLEENLILNDYAQLDHQSIVGDVMHYLKNSAEKFDLIVLDPPAFAKSRRKTHNAVQAYKRLNMLGMKCLNEHGLLMTFSCSQVIDEPLFYNTLVSAGLEMKQEFRVVRKLSQGADHPVNLFHSEGRYLKGLLLQKV